MFLSFVRLYCNQNIYILLFCFCIRFLFFLFCLLFLCIFFCFRLDMCLFLYRILIFAFLLPLFYIFLFFVFYSLMVLCRLLVFCCLDSHSFLRFRILHLLLFFSISLLYFLCNFFTNGFSVYMSDGFSDI